MMNSCRVATRRWFVLSLLPALLCCWSCSGPEFGPEFRKETAPVSGQVHVDGAPPPAGSPIRVEVHPLGEVDTEHPTVSAGATGEDGKFELYTYDKGDGVPLGEYALTFDWRKFDLMRKQFTGPDKLNNRYRNPKTSEVTFTVEQAGEPVDLGVIELTTK